LQDATHKEEYIKGLVAATADRLKASFKNEIYLENWRDTLSTQEKCVFCNTPKGLW